MNDIKARITVVESIYHQTPDSEPKVAEARFSSPLETDEPPYCRPQFKVGEDWTPIDTGWLKQFSMIQIVNEEGKFQTQPTEAERAAMAERVIEVSTGWLIPPGESLRGRPSDLAALQIRCRRGTARVTLNIFPR